MLDVFMLDVVMLDVVMLQVILSLTWPAKADYWSKQKNSELV
jgi:hypothetical protein